MWVEALEQVPPWEPGKLKENSALDCLAAYWSPFVGQTQHACLPSCFSHVWLCVTLWTLAYQAPLSMGFSRQEYCSGLPCPPPGDLPNPGIEPASITSPALAGRFFTTSATWETPDSAHPSLKTPITLPDLSAVCFHSPSQVSVLSSITVSLLSSSPLLSSS